MGADDSEIAVLCVDDEPGFAELVSSFLERFDAGISATPVTSAEEGLDRLVDGPTDCIVSDYDMPGTDGLAFLEAVRAEHPDLPFILFTGRGSEEIASDAISAGVTDYVEKRAAPTSTGSSPSACGTRSASIAPGPAPGRCSGERTPSSRPRPTPSW